MIAFVTEGAGTTFAGIVGREAELGAMQGLLDIGGSERSLVLVGEAGIGKTTLWEAGVELARRGRFRVLAARPTGAEARLSFATLIDLFEEVDSEELLAVPAPQRSALEIGLLRSQPTGLAPEPHAIALGLLNGLRALAARQPVLIAVDDVQWIDDPSADALTFAARRLKGTQVVFLLARRPGASSAIERSLEPRGLDRVEVGALSFSASRQLLSGRLGLVLSRQLLRRVVQATLGNPLFVLEVGRTLLERGVPRVGEDIPVPDRLDDLLGTRVGRLAPGVRRLLLALALSADVRLRELAAVVGTQVVEDAADGGLLVTEGERVRASHPLLAAAAKKHSRPRERREVHRALANAVSDHGLRALHLALATEHPDPDLAATVAVAAREASARGARVEAVTLAEHALRLTPPGASERSERLLELGSYLEVAGDRTRMTELLAPEVDSIPAGALRARAWLLLAEGPDFDAASDYDRVLDLALGQSEEDPGLRAVVLSVKACNTAAALVSRLAEAEAWGLEALDALRSTRREPPEAERRVLYGLAWPSAMRGRSIDELCRRFRAASPAAYNVVQSPQRIAAQRLVWRGEAIQARAEITRLLSLADEQGEPAAYAVMRLHLCELELRVGAWNQASRLLDEWAQSAEAAYLTFPMYERCRALLAAGRGLAGEARDWATKAQVRAEETTCRWDWLEAARARGIAALLEQDPAGAAASLREAWEHTCREGVDDPGVFPVAPELVEALVELGEHDEAMAVTGRLRDLSEQQQHPWGLVSARRCQAVMSLGTRAYDERAALALADAAADYGRLGLRVDRARSLLSLGRAQRRVKKWGVARESLQDALTTFENLGAPGWTRRVRSELGRIGGRRPQESGALTATEREVVELAASGRANKEIAQALSLAVHTVEVHLSRAYAKLGVRSRSQLAGRL